MKIDVKFLAIPFWFISVGEVIAAPIQIETGVNYTSTDRCTPQAVVPQNISLTYGELADLHSAAAHHLVGTLLFDLPFTNCAHGTPFRIAAATGALVGDQEGPQVLANGNQAVGAGLRNTTRWPLKHESTGAVFKGLTAALWIEPKSAQAEQHVLNTTKFIPLCSDCADVISEINVTDKIRTRVAFYFNNHVSSISRSELQQIASGSYKTTLAINVTFS